MLPPAIHRVTGPARLLAGAACLGMAAGALAQSDGKGVVNTGSIYSCVDAGGRTLTSDRPIPACFDREQFELNASGTVKRRIEPRYTAREQAAIEARQREAEQASLRQREERRRERALLVRYPNAATHDRERAEALKQVDAVIDAARKRLSELAEERHRIDGEMEFYARDPAKAPASLRRQIDDNDQAVKVQQRFIGEQEDEKRRIAGRFDEERMRLVQLWSPENGGHPAPRPQP